MNSANELLSSMDAVAAISPDNDYWNSRRCRDCYYYSDVTVKMCVMENEPADPKMLACEMFEPKEDV